MATDVEESDTDDHEKPGPSKKQRVLIAQPLINPRQNIEEFEDIENAVVDEEEDRRAREKLRSWQACQVARAFVDNTINRVLEDYKMSPPASYHFEDPWYRLFRGNQMEDDAVTMAIRNHGLFRSMDLTQSPSLIERVSNVPESIENTQAPVETTTSKTLLITDLEVASTSSSGDWLDNACDSDHHHQDFLDRAVAEAIKKKGLSTLSVEYG